MSIPVFISQFYAAASDTVQVGGGSVQALPRTRYYFYISPLSTADDGQSLLVALKTAADASQSGAVAWTFVLDANLKLRVTHDNGSLVNLILNRGLAWNLGFAKVFGTTYPPDPTLTITIPVPAGAGGYTAEYRSPLYWCPEMGVSDTGPSMFDPMVSPGIRTSAGSTSRAPDGNTSHTKNGEQVEAVFMFRAVEGMWRAREPDLTYGEEGGREREAAETWWRCGPSLGRHFLFWRDKAGLIGLPAAFGTPDRAPLYVQYAPTASLRSAIDVRPTEEGNLYWWDVSISGWLTDLGAGEHLGSG